jgi:hypothetical protein
MASVCGRRSSRRHWRASPPASDPLAVRALVRLPERIRRTTSPAHARQRGNRHRRAARCNTSPSARPRQGRAARQDAGRWPSCGCSAPSAARARYRSQATATQSQSCIWLPNSSQTPNQVKAPHTSSRIPSRGMNRVLTLRHAASASPAEPAGRAPTSAGPKYARCESCSRSGRAACACCRYLSKS